MGYVGRNVTMDRVRLVRKMPDMGRHVPVRSDAARTDPGLAGVGRVRRRQRSGRGAGVFD